VRRDGRGTEGRHGLFEQYFDEICMECDYENYFNMLS
jgi:hypothetical protein